MLKNVLQLLIVSQNYDKPELNSISKVNILIMVFVLAQLYKTDSQQFKP